jgi:Cof subfamily protein (haloacid dehalogenase superfamily)
MIRLIACDLDGTLVDREGRIREEDVAALERARALGVRVVIATGRMPNIIDHFLDRLRVRPADPVVGAQGAVIARRDGRILRLLTLPHAVAEEGVTLARAHGAIPVIYLPDAILMERVAFTPEQDAYWLGRNLRYDPDPLRHVDGEIIKILAVHPDERAIPALLQAYRRAFRGRADVVQSWHWFVEAVHPQANKGAAIAWIADQMGVTRQEVLALGDAGNDVSMLTWAGVGVAPADAAPEARAAADWIAPPLEEGPVAAALARFLFADD